MEQVKDFKDSSVPQSYSMGAYSEMNYNVANQHVWKVLDTMIHGTTEILRDIKSQEQPVAYIYTKGDTFLIGAYVEFFPNEDDPTKPGNWTYTWTFDETDIPENARRVTSYDATYLSYFRTYGANKHDMYAKTSDMNGDLNGYMIVMIRKWLDENASESDVVVLRLDGIVDFKVQVENGEKIFACIQDGEITQRIKDDANIEK